MNVRQDQGAQSRGRQKHPMLDLLVQKLGWRIQGEGRSYIGKMPALLRPRSSLWKTSFLVGIALNTHEQYCFFLRYFNMIQYIAIFSRYFPEIKLVKNMRNYPHNLSRERLCWDFCDKNAVFCVFATKITYWVFLHKKSAQPKMQSIVLIHHK